MLRSMFATSWPWIWACQWSKSFRRSWSSSSFLEHLRRWIWIYGSFFRHQFQIVNRPMRLHIHGLKIMDQINFSFKQSFKLLEIIYCVTHISIKYWIQLPFKPSEAILVPWVRLTRVLPTSLTLKMDGALMSYQSLRVKGSIIFFLAPFLPPLERPYKI